MSTLHHRSRRENPAGGCITIGTRLCVASAAGRIAHDVLTLGNFSYVCISARVTVVLPLSNDQCSMYPIFTRSGMIINPADLLPKRYPGPFAADSPDVSE